MHKLLKHFHFNTKILTNFPTGNGHLKTEPLQQSKIFGHDGHSLCVSRQQERVVKLGGHHGLGGLLQGQNGPALKFELWSVNTVQRVGDLSHQPLERPQRNAARLRLAFAPLKHPDVVTESTYWLRLHRSLASLSGTS